MKDFGVQSTALVELGAMALQADPVTSGSMEEGRTHRSIVGLQETARRYLGKYLRKGSVRTQNWDKEDLGSEMLECQSTYLLRDVGRDGWIDGSLFP